MNSGRIILIYLAVIYKGNRDAMLNAIAQNFNPDYRDVERVISSLRCNTLTQLDPEFPEYLKKVPQAPLVLFYYGDISLIDDYHYRYNLGIVGSREATEYGLTNTRRLVQEVSQDCVIVSGLARGIDTQAHEAALEFGAKTVAVLGSGIDNPWPFENKMLYRRIIASGGLVISEYPNMEEPDMIHFPQRNRLIAMFSYALLVTEAHGFKTGTSITVHFANTYGREVMAIPYSLECKDSFCNQLLYEGANLVRTGNDILIDMDIEQIKLFS